MTQNPRRSERTGLSVFELFAMFPDEASTRKWFEDIRWQDGRYCGHCGSDNTHPVKNENQCLFGALIVGVILVSRLALSCNQAGFLSTNGFSQCI